MINRKIARRYAKALMNIGQEDGKYDTYWEELDAFTALFRQEEQLGAVKKELEGQGVRFEAVQLVRGLSPGEDIVQYAKDNAIDHIFIGIEKKSRTRKLLLGSTAQFIILKGPCPVTTIK